jgi:ribosomal protein S18 acetylase RimI-like enzyme
MRLRRAGPADLYAVLALESLFPGDRLTRRAWRRLLASPTAVAWVIESVDEGAVLGNLLLLFRRRSPWARVYSLVVAPAARGRGWAQALLAAAEAEASHRGCAGLRLEVREDNTVARHLYAGLGYHEIARLPAYYEDGGDGVQLEKRWPLATSASVRPSGTGA